MVHGPVGVSVSRGVALPPGVPQQRCAREETVHVTGLQPSKSHLFQMEYIPVWETQILRSTAADCITENKSQAKGK